MQNFIFAFQEGRSKYIQIYEQLKLCIEQGYLNANDVLPPIRQLAHSLQVSRNTTLSAYEQLIAEGYIRSENRKGYYVNPFELSLYPNNTKIIHEIMLSTPTIQIDFRAGAVDQKHFPLSIWRKTMYHTLSLPESFLYGQPFGEQVLREQIASYLLQARGVKINPEAIIIGSSTQQLLLYLIQMLKQDYPEIIIEDPGYNGAKEVFHFHQLLLETLKIDETGIDLSNLPNYKARLIYLTPSHQSPIGISMPIQQRHQLIQWAIQNNGYIIEDDYDSEFRYTEKPFPALSSINQQHVIYLGNFSKAFLPGIRLSYTVLPTTLITKFKQIFQQFQNNASLINQLTMARFMQQGEWHRHIKRMRLIYKRKMQCILAVLKEHFQQHITIIGHQSGLYVLIKVHLRKSENTLIQNALLQGVKVYPTSIYYSKHIPKEPIIKLGFSNLTCKEIQTGIALLKKAWLD